MKTKIIEVVHSHEPGTWGNWGKFLLGQFDEHEFDHPLMDKNFFTNRWTNEHIWILDLETGEGALFRHGGLASADLNKHRVWVCPMFEPFLNWLYTQSIEDIDALPAMVELPDAEFAMQGYRRPGPAAEHPAGANT